MGEANATWKRWCSDGSCVETTDVLLVTGKPGVAIRTSTDPTRYVLATRDEWDGLVLAIEAQGRQQAIDELREHAYNGAADYLANRIDHSES